jgi:hypothetical protein
MMLSRRVSVPQLSEDFARWRGDDVTKLVFKALGMAAQAQKDEWDRASWGGGVVRAPELERLLIELRVRADSYAALEAMTAEDLMTWLGIEQDAE